MQREEARIKALHKVFRFPWASVRGIARCVPSHKAEVPGDAGQERRHAGSGV